MQERLLFIGMRTMVPGTEKIREAHLEEHRTFLADLDTYSHVALGLQEMTAQRIEEAIGDVALEEFGAKFGTDIVTVSVKLCQQNVGKFVCSILVSKCMHFYGVVSASICTKSFITSSKVITLAKCLFNRSSAIL